ncbi:unnamed protein product, partial [Onchocerca ochengi]|uniref:Uncharacterized protein n=1 Tax=Onchocerca ochengi TaxID=42157 RepID=A0A182EGR0_ONCOC
MPSGKQNTTETPFFNGIRILIPLYILQLGLPNFPDFSVKLRANGLRIGK